MSVVEARTLLVLALFKPDVGARAGVSVGVKTESIRRVST